MYKNSCDTCRAANAAAGIESTDENTEAYCGESFGHLGNILHEEVSFSMKVVRRFLFSFEREVAGSIFIEVNQNNNILNHEFNRCLIPRLSVMMGENEYKSDLSHDTYDESEFDEKKIQ